MTLLLEDKVAFVSGAGRGIGAAAARLFAREGRMILFSSHRLDVVEKVCSSVVILHHGRIVARTGASAVQDASGSASLEDVFARVTEQEDYTTVAKDILSVMQDV